MIEWVTHYEVASIVLYVALLSVVVFNKFILTKTAKIYISLVILGLIAALLNLASVYTLSMADEIPLWMNYTLNSTFLLLANCSYVIYAYYFSFVLTPNLVFSKLKKVVFLSAPVLIFLALVTTPWTHFIYIIDPQLGYIHGKYYLYMFALGLMFLIYTIILAIVKRSILTKSQAAAVSFYSVSLIASIVLQNLLDGYMLTSFATALSLIVIYMSLQNDLDDSDKMLGTYTNDALHKQIQVSISEKESFSMVSLKIKGFEKLNNAYGFDKANSILRDIADDITRVTPNRKVFHMTGVSFTCIFNGTKEEVYEFAKVIEGCMLREADFDGNKVKIDLDYNIAITKYPEHGDNVEDLLDIINYTLFEYSAKEDTKILEVDDKSVALVKRRKAVEKAVERAIKRKSFEVYYQPIYSTVENRITSAEALVRLKDEEIGDIYPDEFIPMAEKNGSIANIDGIVLEKVCRFIKDNRIREKGIDYVEVNLSPQECMRDDLIERITSTMDRYGITSECINLEITESAANGSNSAIVNNMNKLSELNIAFSMDDYGTGYSNTTRMVDLPFSLVKLDKSILWHAMESAKAMSILANTVAMLHELELEIVVEGVETEEQLTKLKELGCQHLQGYFFSKPVPEGEFIKYIEGFNS